MNHSSTTNQNSVRQFVFGLYLLLLAGPFTGMLSVFVALMIAYLTKNSTPGTIYESHVESILTTGWVSLVGSTTLVLAIIYSFYLGISGASPAIGTYLAIACFTAIVAMIFWYVYRVARGLWCWINNRPTYSIMA